MRGEDDGTKTERPLRGTELAKAKNAASYGRLCRYDSLFANGRPVFYLICLRCGTVVRSFVEDPAYFKSKIK
ncbi:hypothetical protein D1646_04190 [Pseudoflavonifractor sp. 60]|uniref:hypothetical protein n=1 Tax=Pseudoflavonifractor sp. 60 TaxID=2304576 RepID=UPI00136D54EC|nr:hypothetical protein [Pseudoflavonifractor sp. 60]NBI66022.1 hypothetical protein [Pseudoflavonifractor sp. 60]